MSTWIRLPQPKQEEPKLMTTNCRRCGVRCQAGIPTRPNSRPFRRATQGLCANCVVTVFFRGDEEGCLGFALPADFDPHGLRAPHIQDQFQRILNSGGSELTADEIDWGTVIANWGLPL